MQGGMCDGITYCLCVEEGFSEYVCLLSSGVATVERGVTGGVALGVETVGYVV